MNLAVVPEKYLDLCSFVIAHRFSSPLWLKILSGHVSADKDNMDDMFAKVGAPLSLVAWKVTLG